MACLPTPTETLYDTVITSTESSTFSDSITTLPPVFTTLVSQSCTLSQNSTESSCSDITVTSTIDVGGPSTIQVPVTLTIPVTNVVPTATLFSDCPPPGPPDPPNPPNPGGSSNGSSQPPSSTSLSSTPSSMPSSTQSSTTLITTLVTPIPQVITSQVASTLPNGNVVETYVTMTSTYPPTSVVIQSPPPSQSTGVSNHPGGNMNDFIGPVVGGVLGGFFGLIGMVFGLWFCWSKRKHWLRENERELPPDLDMAYYSPSSSRRPVNEPEPRPYHYGLVGRASSHPSRGASPPPKSISMSSRSPTAVDLSTNSQSNLSKQRHSYPSPTQPSESARLHSHGSHQSLYAFPTSATPSGTFMIPGSSQPSSRPSTPGHQSPAPPRSVSQPSPTYPPSAYHNQYAHLPPGASPPAMRHVFPQTGEDQEFARPRSASPHTPRSSRRPSRLSLNWNSTTTEGGPPSTPASTSKLGHSAEAATATATTTTAVGTSREVSQTSSDAVTSSERPRSVLFVVNSSHGAKDDEQNASATSILDEPVPHLS